MGDVTAQEVIEAIEARDLGTAPSGAHILRRAALNIVKHEMEQIAAKRPPPPAPPTKERMRYLRIRNYLLEPCLWMVFVALAAYALDLPRDWRILCLSWVTMVWADFIEAANHGREMVGKQKWQ